MSCQLVRSFTVELLQPGSAGQTGVGQVSDTRSGTATGLLSDPVTRVLLITSHGSLGEQNWIHLYMYPVLNTLKVQEPSDCSAHKAADLSWSSF